MSMKTTKVIMKCIGGTLAICSAMAIAGGMMEPSVGSSTKKTMKKTINKMSDIADTISAFL